MSFLTQSELAWDAHILQRVTACAAMEGVLNPSAWVNEHAWQLSAQPGWVEAYKHAVDSGDGKPGANEAAVTDGMILAAVQRLLGIEPEPEPEPEAEAEAEHEEPDPEPEEPEPAPEQEPEPEPETDPELVEEPEAP